MYDHRDPDHPTDDPTCIIHEIFGRQALADADCRLPTVTAVPCMHGMQVCILCNALGSILMRGYVEVPITIGQRLHN